MLASLVIPAYKPYSLLKNLLTSVYLNTDLSLIEIIVVLNGSDRESLDLLLNEFPEVNFYWSKEALGFTKAANIGISLVNTPVTILCNTDVVILDYCNKNDWLFRLIKPFEDPTVGITGLGRMHYIWSDYFAFYFTAIRSELFKKIGMLDLDFSPGYGEDLDFCIRTKIAGYKLHQVDVATHDDERHIMISDYPLYHQGEGSFVDKLARNKYLENQYNVLHKKWGQQRF
jgi:GT2 family glycosyltransferase